MRNREFGILIGVAFIGGFVAIVALNRPSQTSQPNGAATATNAPSEPVKANQKWDALGAVCVQSEYAVRGRLKAPSTAVFPSCSAYKVAQKDGNTFVVGYVDAQNTFGAQIRSKFIVKLDGTGSEWRVIDVGIYGPE
jgi:hypothetical protein